MGLYSAPHSNGRSMDRAAVERLTGAQTLAALPSESLQFRASQKSQSSSSVLTALPITYEDPEPEKKSWFSVAAF